MEEPMMSSTIQLQIDTQALNRLIQCGQLKIDDFRCCDNSTKNLIKNMYLEAVKQSIGNSR